MRIRGSLVDSVTLEEFPFDFEPQLKDKETTNYGKQNIIGHRLPNYMWVGSGDSVVEIEVYLLEWRLGVKMMIEQFKNLLKPQADLGAPHPVYVNIGDMYVGRKFVLTSFETDVQTFHIEDSVAPMEAKAKMKLEEIPIDRRYSGAGAR